jgi:penicillin-insensitive murein endopeptidase
MDVVSRSRCLLLSWLCAAAVLLSQASAWGVDTPSTVNAGDSRSTGLPWKGRLIDGVRLRPSATVRHLPERLGSDNFYGTRELVSLLERVASAVARRWPGSQLSVGELSAQRGGWIEGHHSHRNGRDADVAFFMRDEQGGIERFWRFVTFERSGLAKEAPAHLRFDDARNWAVVAHTLRDPEARVQYMFVARPIRARLLMAGRRQGETHEFLRAAAAVLVEPKRGHSHQNHFHVRIFCARDDSPQCEDSEPYWPWYEGEPPGGRYAELPAIHWRAPATPKQDPPREVLTEARHAEHRGAQDAEPPGARP